MYSSTHSILPEHPGDPKWQSFKEWNTMRTPQSIQVVKSAKETQEEAFERFGLTDEGWGDATNPQDAGWGLPQQDQDGGGW
jgi:hypothetical protein